ncbi:Cytoplasmic protein [Mycena indigotica]|uniref:Cytoplasmic protein n=1 Tax=Mycena indigotica TaxID=2126181 RepID=A0A8H6T982_9AGAR|nr:Cytoplasmic protein [Mycena indigotica]KAF7312667.1 Cytoplasmic protein [Mycena indigotica]
MPPSRLPIELWERVMDDLSAQGDSKALGVCSLVCMRWSRRSEFLLYSDVRISDSNWQRFLELFASTSSAGILFCTKRLTLDITSTRQLHTLVTTIASKFPVKPFSFVEHVSLRNLDLTELPLEEQRQVQGALAQTMKNISALELNNATFHDIHHCVRFTSVFPRLASLGLVDVRFLKYYFHHHFSSMGRLKFVFSMPASWKAFKVDGGEAVPILLCALLATDVADTGLELELLNIEDGHRLYVEECIAILKSRGIEVLVSKDSGD